jgi:hypothetical protein
MLTKKGDEKWCFFSAPVPAIPIIAVCSKVGGHVLFPFLTHFDG